MPFPEEGLVYDYQLDDAGISLPAMEEDEEEENKSRKVSLSVCPSACPSACQHLGDFNM